MDQHRSRQAAARSRVSLASKWREVGWPALATAVLLWAAQPPLGLSLLAWVAPIGLLWLIDRGPAPGKTRLLLYLGCGMRLLASHYARHTLGLLAIDLWLASAQFISGCLLSIVCGGVTHLVQRCRWPLMVTAPIVWVGCELWRSYLLTGYAASSLAHSQYRQLLSFNWPIRLGITASAS